MIFVTATPNTLGGFIYTRSEYNAKGQLTKQYQDTGSNTATTAPTLYEYDAFGNMTKQTLALSDSPTPLNSPVTEMAYSIESTDEGVFSVMTNTRYNAVGNPLMSVQKSLMSNLSDAIESKNLTIDERNLTSTQWVEYHVGTKRKSYNSLPTSNITAETVSVDGFTLSQTDNGGVTTTNGRSYTANGMIQTRTNGRGNTATTVTDTAGRPLAIQKDATWYSAPARLASQGFRSQVCSRLGVWLLKSHPAYGWDLTKNICELYGSNGYIRTAYTYTPYGEVTASGDVTQPIHWSSEYNDTELGLVYYNYRHYNPMDGRWLGKDLISQKKIYNSYSFVCNNVSTIDRLGLKHMKASTSCDGSVEIKQYSPFFQDNYPNETIYYKGEKQGVLAGVFITVMYQQGNLSDSCCCSSWRWMQTIWTNAPLGGDSSPYVDPRPNTDDKPWYYTDEDYEKHKLINGTVFFDSPTREGKEGTNIYWRAELILKCLNKKGKVKRDIVYIYYGFHIYGDKSMQSFEPNIITL